MQPPRPELTRVRTLLDRSLHFRDLAPSDRDALTALCRLRKLRDGELAGRATQPPDEMWIVLEGGLRLSTVTDGGEEFIYAVLGPGSFYGLGNVVGVMNTLTDARAFGPTELAILDGPPFIAMLDANPRLWRHVSKLLVRRLSLAMSIIRDFSVAPLDQRIVRRLLGQAMGGGADITADGTIDMRVNQSDLGRMLGSSRSRVNAELKRMEGDGLVEVGYRNIKLVDLPRLREIAGPEVFAF